MSAETFGANCLQLIKTQGQIAASINAHTSQVEVGQHSPVKAHSERLSHIHCSLSIMFTPVSLCNAKSPINRPVSMHACHNGSCLPPSFFLGTATTGAQCLCHLLIAFFPHGRGMALCRRPKEEKEGQAANLELAGRE